MNNFIVSFFPEMSMGTFQRCLHFSHFSKNSREYSFYIMHNYIGLKCSRKPPNPPPPPPCELCSRILKILVCYLPSKITARTSLKDFKIFVYFFCNFSSFLPWNFFKLHNPMGIAYRNILAQNKCRSAICSSLYLVITWSLFDLL